MATQEIIRDVPAGQVDALVARYKMLGATVQSFAQTNGLFTVVALFDGPAHSTPFATATAAEIVTPLTVSVEPKPQGPSSSTDFAELAPEYRQLFDTCLIAAPKRKLVTARVEHMQANQARYRALAAALQMPWTFIAIVHAMESNFNFTAHLHNGDPLSGRTVQAPAGRPAAGNPPFTWEQSARDAFEMKGYTGQTQWTTAHMLFRLEAYNGFGYRAKGVATPYLWSYCQHYKKGKFIKDHVFDAEAVSKQAGAAVLLKAYLAAVA